MADKPTKTPGSITQPSDSNDERISEISNVNRTISNMQKQIDQDLNEIDNEIESSKAISSIQSSMSKVLRNLGYTVSDIGKGFTQIAADTAKSGKDAISQYGKAISQDISYNKQNIVAMALSKSTPIYGYFISKFMETDVWKSATERLKANIGNALSSVGQKLKTGMSSIFRKKPKNENEPLSKKAKNIPHMARGGIVKKEGLAKLHAAEVVMPIDKLLTRIDDQMSLTNTIAKTTQRTQLHSMAKMNTYVGSLEKYQKTGLIRGFFKALQEVQTEYEEPAEQRMLRALLAIQDALGGQVGSWTQVWQKMLIRHPTFRMAMITGNLLKKTLAAPFKPVYGFFKSRGGYKGHLSSSSQPLEALNENIGTLYTGSMFRMDAIALYTKATAEATRDLSSMITGKRYQALPGIRTGRWSLFGLTRKILNLSTNFLIKTLGKIISIPKKYKYLSPKFSKVADILTKQRQLPKLGMAKYFESIYGNEEAGTGIFGKSFSEPIMKFVNIHGAIPVHDVNVENIFKFIKSQVKIDEKSAETTNKLLQITDQSFKQKKQDFNLSKKVLKVAQENYKENKQSNERERRRSIFGFLSGGFGAVKSMLGSIFSFIGPLLFGGGLFKSLASVLTGGISDAFLGNIKPGSSGILGAFWRGVKKLTLKFPKGFMKKILPALVSLPKTIVSSIVGVLKSGSFTTAMGGALAVAAAGVIGWQIGKNIDTIFGISEKFKDKLNEWDKRGDILAREVGAISSENLRKVKGGGKTGYAAKRSIGMVTDIGKMGEVRTAGLGYFGRANMSTINEAQRKYMQEHINDYLKYSPDVVTNMRSQWLNSNRAFRPKFPGEDSEEYGALREQAFLIYLQKKAKPMTSTEAAEEYSKYKNRFKTIERARMELEERTGGIREKIGGAYIKITDLAKNEVKELSITSQALKDELIETSKKYWEGSKDATDKLLKATNAQTVVVSNSISNISNTAVNGASNLINKARDEYTSLLMRGEAAGD